ncbi:MULTISPECIES: hypothetical protein [Myroides]|uniref:Uncharacterized protein n=1 Tax=Myroides albus TaxID=2562892 RepID=A0A6I3LEE9_9FLAO|nr:MULTISPECIES: hypothetical protein [Myroides]MTG97839.1 hypothetical protein [Myroides albus]MVX35961.1 hypothetical protein [Myroides sp. LoEW2-1]UVD79796.1 hypothetical protein NWE55_00440 [Myroides albus]
MKKEDFVYSNKLYTLYKERSLNNENSQGILYPFYFSDKLISDKKDFGTSFCIYSIYENKKLLGQITTNQITLNSSKPNNKLPIMYLVINNEEKLMCTDLITKLIERIKLDFAHIKYFYCFNHKVTNLHKDWSSTPSRRYKNNKINLIANNW